MITDSALKNDIYTEQKLRQTTKVTTSKDTVTTTKDTATTTKVTVITTKDTATTTKNDEAGNIFQCKSADRFAIKIHLVLQITFLKIPFLKISLKSLISKKLNSNLRRCV